MRDLRNNDGTSAFTVQPALQLSQPGIEYMVNAHVPFTDAANGQAFTLWRVDCPACSQPTVTRSYIDVFDYQAPPFAEQKDTTIKVNTGDGRLLNAVYRLGELWTTHAVESFYSPGESAIRVYSIDVGNESHTNTEINPATQQLNFYNASVTTNADGNQTAVYNYSSPSFFPGMTYLERISGSWTTAVYPKNGENAHTSPDWGDYAGSSPDPDGTTVWLYNEFSRNVVGAASWGSWVAAAQ